MLMSVNPGFGGQSFIESTLRKIESLRNRIEKNGLSTDIEIDGGISPQTIARVAGAGANIFVAGSAVYGSANYADTIATMKQLAQKSFPG